MAIDGLDELNSGVSDDINDVDIVDDNDQIDGTNESNDQEDQAPGNPDAPVVEQDRPEEISNLSGIEQYLSQFSIEGGMIDFQDGTRAHFNDLDAAKQVDVLSKLHNASTQTVEDKYGLDEEEIGLINYIREQGKPIDTIIDELAQQRAQTYIMSQQVASADVNSMNEDQIYTSFLLKSNPKATPDQLEQDLATAKQMSNFNNIVANLKSGMLKEHEAQVLNQRDEGTRELYAEIEDQRKQVVDIVGKMESIDGLSINDGIKNDVLDLILNVDDDGDSLFMTEVFSDPEKLFRAAFWYKNGTDIISAREAYWKKEKSAAYKRGLSEGQLGKRSFSSSDVRPQNATTPSQMDSEEIQSFDDLYS